MSHPSYSFILVSEESKEYITIYRGSWRLQQRLNRSRYCMSHPSYSFILVSEESKEYITIYREDHGDSNKDLIEVATV